MFSYSCMFPHWNEWKLREIARHVVCLCVRVRAYVIQIMVVVVAILQIKYMLRQLIGVECEIAHHKI